MNIRTASGYSDHRYGACPPAVSLRARPAPHELPRAVDVALLVVDGSPPCLRIDPTGDRSLDEVAQFSRVEAVAGGERGPAGTLDKQPPVRASQSFRLACWSLSADSFQQLQRAVDLVWVVAYVNAVVVGAEVG
jgi:hypothetical protein